MKKHTLIIILLLIILVSAGCGQNKENITKESITEEQIVSLQAPVIEFIMNDKVFEAFGCYSQPDEISGLNTMYIEANEDDNVDFEAYKEKIWENVGAKFNIIFELTPFPTDPTTTGVIRAVEYEDPGSKAGYLGTILVVSQTSDFTTSNGESYYDANRINVYEGVPIINKSEETLTFDDLQIGMYVDSYYRGITVNTYPGIQGTEKLVIHEDFQIPMAGDSMTKEIIGEIFNNQVMTGPYPIIGYGYSKEFLKGNNRLLAHLDAGGTVFYKDIETLENPGVFMGSLQLHYIIESGDVIEYKIPDVVVKVDEGIDFTIEGDYIIFEVAVYENDSLQTVKYFVNEKGLFSTMEP